MHARLRRAVLVGSLVVVPATVHAADGYVDTSPPLVTMDALGGAGQWTRLTMRIEYCDNVSLDLTTLQVLLNGVSQSPTWTSGSKSGCVAYGYTDVTVTLALGANTVYAEISDLAGNLGSVTRNFSYGVTVKPVLSSMTAGQSSSDSVLFVVHNTSATTRTFTLSSTCSGTTSGCAASPGSVTLDPWGVAQVKATYSTGAGTGAGTVSLTATNGTVTHTASAGVTVVTGSVYLVTDWTIHNYDNIQPALCAASCFDTRYALSTVPYYSLDTPRSITLAYNGAAVAVRPVVSVDVNLKAGASGMTEAWLEAKDSTGAAITFVNGDTKLRFSPGSVGTRFRLSGQFDAGAYTSGVYPITLLVSEKYAATTETQTIATKFAVVNERRSPVARGWSISGLSALKAIGGAVAIIGGDGSLVYFTGNCTPACNGYTSPYGDYTHVWSSGTGGSKKYTREFPDSSRSEYDANGTLLRLITRTLDTTSFTYDGFGRLTQVSDPFRTDAGNLTHLYTALAYNTYGLASITEPGLFKVQSGGRSTVVTVNGTDSTLTSWKDPADSASSPAVTFGNDGGTTKRLTTVTNRNGDVTTFKYNSVTWKLDSLISPSFAKDSRLPGSATVQVKSKLIPWQTISVPTTSTASTLFQPGKSDTLRGRVLVVSGVATAFTADRWGQPLTTTVQTPAFAFLRADTLIRRPYSVLVDRLRSQEGMSEVLTYDHALVAMDSVAPMRGVRTYYTKFAQPDSIVQRGTPKQAFFVGTRGRVDSVLVSGTYKTRYVYDSRHRVTSVQDPAGHTVYTFYNTTFGSADTTTASGSRTSMVLRDGYGRDTASKAGAQPWRRHRMDKVNRDTVVILESGVGVPTNDLTHLTYSDGLHRSTITDPLGGVYTYDYNAIGVTTKTTDPAGNVDSIYVDSLGRASRWRNRRGDTLITRYDVLGRKVADTLKVGATVTKANAFAYDANWLWSAASNAVSRDTVTIDATGFVTKVVTRLATGSFGTSSRVERQYVKDSVGRFDSVLVAFPGSIASTGRKYVTDQVSGQLNIARVNGANGVTFNYTNELLPQTKTYTGGAIDTLSATTVHDDYRSRFNNTSVNDAFWRGGNTDEIGRIDIGFRLFTSVNLQRRYYSYDARGRLAAMRDTAVFGVGLCEGTPDPDFGETPCVTGTPVYQRRDSLKYDALGNIVYVSDTLSSGVPTYATTGNRAKIKTWPNFTFSTDSAGNVTQRIPTVGSTTNFYWSGDGLLDSTKVGTRTAVYEYNAFGQLVRKRVLFAGVDSTQYRRHFYWDAGHLLAELDSNLAKRRSEYAYYPGVDQPLAILTGATTVTATRFVQQDLSGNVSGLLTNANTVDSYASDTRPWGEYDYWASTAVLDTLRLRYKALLWEGDSTKLMYVRARWYDPVTHRFMSQDPSGLSGGINPYVFAANDPVNMSDPDGMKSVCYRNTSTVTSGKTSGFGPATSSSETYYSCYSVPDYDDELLDPSLPGQGPASGGGGGGGWPAKGKFTIIRKVPNDAMLCTGPTGRMFFAPPGFNIGEIQNTGARGGRLNPIAAYRNVWHFGRFDFQRQVRYGGDTLFISAYTPVSNVAVGAYLRGAGFGPTTSTIINDAAAYLANTSNAGDPNQKIFRNEGYLAASSGNYSCQLK